MIGDLPRSVEVNGQKYRIRTDFRDILKILAAFNDPELEDSEKVYVCLLILFRDFDTLPMDDLEEAYKVAIRFIDCGTDTKSGKKKKSARTMDWEQDESLIFPAINKVAGQEVRSMKYVHWWTFMGWFMEIDDGVYSNVLSLRQKKAKGKKLEKWEREYWIANKDICVLKTKYSKAELEAQERIKEMYGYSGGK